MTKPDDPPSYGQYVSIWRREGSGPWKVEVDLGISHSGPRSGTSRCEARQLRAAAWEPRAAAAPQAEEQFARDVAPRGARAAYAAHGAERPPLLPQRRRAGDRQGGGARRARAWTTTASSGSPSASRPRAPATSATRAAATRAPRRPAKVLGHYLRVWRLEAGEWRVALDVTNPRAEAAEGA